MKLRTQEVCGKIGVSPTTLKRWVAHFPSVFHKDQLGHYWFGEQELQVLRHIKAEVRSGVRLEQIRLPMLPEGNARMELAAAVEAVLGSSAGQDASEPSAARMQGTDQAVIQGAGQAAAMKQTAQAVRSGPVSAESRASALAAELAAGRGEVAAAAGASEVAAAGIAGANRAAGTGIATGATEAAGVAVAAEEAGEAGEAAVLQAQSTIGALQARIELLERTVSRKADDVVTAQLYHHRQEIDEMRQMLRMLAAVVEGLQYAGSIRRSEPPAMEQAIEPKPTHQRGFGIVPRRQRRKILWLF